MSDFDMKTLADNLRGERAKTRMSQEQAARKIGVSQASIQKWEAGEVVPTIESIFALANLYGIEIDTLCGRQAPSKHSA